MAFLKQTEFCLGRFFQTQPKLIGNPVLVARGQGTFLKNIVGLTSSLERARLLSADRYVNRDGVSGPCRFWKQRQSPKVGSRNSLVASFLPRP